MYWELVSSGRYSTLPLVLREQTDKDVS